MPPWGIMQSIRTWLASLSDDPIAQFAIFLATILIRFEVDRWHRLREERQRRKRKGAAHG